MSDAVEMVIAIGGTIAGLIVTISAIVFVWRRGQTRKTRLEFTWSSTPILNAAAQGEDVKIQVNGHEMPDPHFVSVQLTNRGPGDISQSQFDGATPLRISLTRHQLNQVPDGKILEVIEIAPQLIKDDPVTATRIVEGERAAAILTKDDVLVGVKIVDGSIQARRRRSALINASNVASVLLTSSAFISTRVFGKDSYLPWIPFGLSVAFIAISSITFVRAWRSR